jgi:predicted dehydrogenase
MYNVGIIGLTGQAAAWVKVVSANPSFQVKYLYHPDLTKHLLNSEIEQTADINSLITQCDLIIVSSPTHTHLGYLNQLGMSYSGTVLVEKPVVGLQEDCGELLRTLPRSFLERVFVSHTFRFYPWVQKIDELLHAHPTDQYISAEIQLSHDFAFKPAYAHSWRSRAETHPIGPAETQGIHLIDLVHYFFGSLDWLAGQTLNLAGTGSAPDTASLMVCTQGRVMCALHTSYAAPVSQYLRICGINRIIEYRDGLLCLYARPAVPAEGRSRTSDGQVLMCLDPDTLQTGAMQELLNSVKGCMEGLSDPRLATIFQGIANVAVLAGYQQSLRLNTPCRLSRDNLYNRVVVDFKKSQGVHSQ